MDKYLELSFKAETAIAQCQSLFNVLSSMQNSAVSMHHGHHEYDLNAYKFEIDKQYRALGKYIEQLAPPDAAGEGE